MIPYGSCVSWRVPPKLNGFFERIFGWLQNKITGMPETHCSMVMSSFPEKPGSYYEYEVSVTARIVEFRPNEFNTVYSVLAPESFKVLALDKLRHKTEGNIYGLWQTVVFIIRAVVEKLGFDGRRIWNPLSWLDICSEGLYVYLYELSTIMKWYDITFFMDQWSKDVFHAGDARIVLDYMVEKGKAERIWN